jgi:hypothetical protein
MFVERRPNMPTITCPKCGTENPADATICQKCRIDLKFALEHPEAVEPLKQREKPREVPLDPKFRWLAIVLAILLFAASIIILRGVVLWMESSLSWEVVDGFQDAFADRPVGISILLLFVFLLVITWCLQAGVWLAERIQRYAARNK